jgi:hypothetical protein
LLTKINILGISSKTKLMVKACTILKTEVSTKENSNKAHLMVRGITFFQIWEMFIKDPGLMVKCMGKEYTSLRIKRDMRGTGIKGISTEREK